MTRRLIIRLLCLILLLLISLFYVAYQQSKGYARDPRVLMNTFYHLKSTHPAFARLALDIILKQNPDDRLALEEYSQWLLNQQQYEAAIPLLKHLQALLPQHPEYVYQLGYAHYQAGSWVAARSIFLKLSHQPFYFWKIKAQDALNAMASFLPLYAHAAQWTAQSKAQLFEVRSEKQNQSMAKALSMIQTPVVVSQPAFPDKYRQAMEKAYAYNQQNQQRLAYAYFQKAAKSSDPTLALQAENAMTHLVGQQTRSFEDPYYGEIFFMPFSQSHFNLVINQFIGRLGIEQPNRWQTKEYVYIRRTSDNRSENLGELSEIYEDNVQITGMGVQLSPLPHVPLIGYIEGGIAYDMVYRARDLWRGDLRGGFMYYQEVGKQAAYYPEVTIKPDYYATYYGDITYFSRYANNVIGTLRTHQGLRAIQYKSSMVNLYLKGRLIQDSQRLFFNNIAEAGPGLGLIPSNRFNVELRFEYLKGVYLPAGGLENPYRKYYVNKVAQLLCYVKF